MKIKNKTLSTILGIGIQAITVRELITIAASSFGGRITIPLM